MLVMDRQREEHVEPVGGPRAAHRSAPAPSFACSCSPTKSASPVRPSPLSHERGMYARRRLTPLLGSAAHLSRSSPRGGEDADKRSSGEAGRSAARRCRAPPERIDKEENWPRGHARRRRRRRPARTHR
jgi:hypothetical protein